MRKPLLVTLGLVLAIGTLVAQTHNNMIEKRVSDIVLFTSDVRVGTMVLKAGEYEVACDTKTVTFTLRILARDQEWFNTLDPVEQQNVLKPHKVLEVPCVGRDLSAAADQTLMELGPDRDGVRPLNKLCLRGSSVEHTFN